MRTKLRKTFTLLLCLALCLSFAPPAWAVTRITSASGSTYSTIYASKLDDVFQGRVALFSNSSDKYSLGASLNNDKQYTVAGKISGSQCYIYAQGVYYYLFGDIPYHGSGYSGYWSNSSTVLTNQGEVSYSLFQNAGVGFGAYIRTTSNSDGSYNGSSGHSMILLSYDANKLSVLEGNADNNGLIRITELTWAEFNQNFLSGKSRRIAHVVQYMGIMLPASYLDQCTSFDCNDIVEISVNPTYLKSLPCSISTDSDSVTVVDTALPLGTTLQTTRLYINTEGNYWYAATIISGPYEGKSGYIYKNDTHIVHAPQSVLDEASGGAGTIHVRGWSFDRDSLESYVRIHVYIGGPAGSGANGYEITANTYRPDVNNAYSGVGNNHGFDETIRVNERGTKTLYFYSIDVGGGPGNQLFNTATVTISDTDSQGILDLNGVLDGTVNGDLGTYGVADVYINGALAASGVKDFCNSYPPGTSYEIKNIKANRGYSFDGIHEGSLSGTIGNSLVNVLLAFSSNSDPAIQLDVPLLPQETGHTCADASARECIGYYYQHGLISGKSSSVPSEAQLVSEYGTGSSTPIVNGLRDYCGVTFGYREKTTQDDFYTYVSNSLKKGNPVVAEVYLNTDTSWVLGYTTNGHYIVISGIKNIGGEEYLTITDPWNKNGAGIGQIIDVPWIHICNICVYYVCEQNGLEVAVNPTGYEMTAGAGRTIPDGDYIIASAADSNFYLDIDGNAYPATECTNVHLWGPRDETLPAEDTWTVTYIDNGGFYSICQKGTEMSLDVDRASITAGGNLQVYPYHDANCQKWSISENTNGSYRIQAKHSGLSLDIADGIITAGTGVRQWNDNDSIAQQWTFIPYSDFTLYSIRYDANGGVNPPVSQTTTYGNNLLIITSVQPIHANTRDDSYCITLDANGGIIDTTLLSTEQIISYTFSGWNTKMDGSGLYYLPGESYEVDSDITLYAQWNSTATTSAVKLPEPTQDGYVFLGWTTSNAETSVQYRAGDSVVPTSDVTLYAVWEIGTLSDWSETAPTDVDESLIETRTQYRYRNKEEKTSGESSMDGWILENTDQSWGEYGPWSEWQDEVLLESDTTIIEARTAYPYYYFFCTHCGRGARYPYWGTNLACEICGNIGTRPVEANSVEWFSNPWSDSVPWGTNTGKDYQYIDGGIWWNWTDGTPKMQYRASTRNMDIIYHYYRWTDWSPWQDIELDASDSREIEIRTLYRYLIKTLTLTYNANGGSGAPEAQTKTPGEALALSAAIPTRSGYYFLGWAENANAASAAYLPGGSFTKDADTTRYAVWAQPDFVMPAALTTVGEEAFANCAFHFAALSQSTTELERNAFAGCTNLCFVYIPEACVWINRDAFGTLTNLTILGTSGSYAQTYAQQKGYTFIPVA